MFNFVKTNTNYCKSTKVIVTQVTTYYYQGLNCNYSYCIVIAVNLSAVPTVILCQTDGNTSLIGRQLSKLCNKTIM